MGEIGPYGKLARWVLSHPRRVTLGLVLLSVISIVLGLPPKVDANLLNLLPPSDRSVQALHRLQDEGGTNLVTLAFAGDDSDIMEQFLDDLVVDLEAMDTVEFAFHEVDPDLAFRIGMLQFTPQELTELNARLRGALALGPALNPIVTQRLMDMGPLTERIAKTSDTSLFQREEGEGRILLRPTGSAHEPLFAMPFMESLEVLLDDKLAGQPEVELTWIGGAYRHNVEDVKGIRTDLLWTSGASALLVLLVIGVSFRSARSTIIVFTPLLIANLVNLALVYVFVESLNTYTSFGAAILFGLGIDFAVHLVGRYREERLSGRETQEAIERAWDRVGPPCTTAALTSAAGFLALAVAEFRGFAQLGTLLAAGLLICLVVMLIALPLLLSWLDTQPKLLLGVQEPRPTSSRSTYSLAPTGLMIAVLVTALLGGLTLPRMQFEYDISSLRRDGLAYNELSETEQALARESYAPVVASVDTREELADLQRRADELIESDKLPHVARAVSIESILPSDQAQRIEALRELIGMLEHPNRRYIPPQIMRHLLSLEGRDVQPLALEDVPQSVRTVLGAGGHGSWRLMMVPKGNMWDVREASELTDEIYEGFGEQEVAGEYLSVTAMFRLALHDMPLVAGLALMLVTVLAFIDLRKVHWVAGAVGTLVAGMIWAGAAVHGAGVRFNLINIAGIPILLGIGVDVVIHLLHRLAEEGPGGVRRALGTTGVAATISTLTTVFSFCSLLLAGNRGVRSLGIMVVLGLTTVFLASAALLPLAWSAGWKVTGRAPADTLKERGSSEEDSP